MRNDGYQGSQLSNSKVLLKKTKILKKILKNYTTVNFNKMLIAGCGKGDEALAFREVFSGNIIGIDISLPEIVLKNYENVKLIKGDLQSLPFPKSSFSFIYNYHVLEHVENPSTVLKEFSRVLEDSGVIFIGFPNRLRLTPSYLNANIKKSVSGIIKNNAKDYWAKITGKFKNELGAHAGFSEKEFLKMAQPFFNEVIPVRSLWVKYQYPKFYRFAQIINVLKLSNYFYPSNYYLLRK